MSYIYDLVISFDLGNAIPVIKGLEENLNAHFSAMGRQEKTVIRSRVSATITSDSELTEDQKAKMSKSIEETMDNNKSFSYSCHAKVESFRRQSGNVQQSAESVS